MLIRTVLVVAPFGEDVFVVYYTSDFTRRATIVGQADKVLIALRRFRFQLITDFLFHLPVLFVR
jgi:hypothetical protein